MDRVKRVFKNKNAVTLVLLALFYAVIAWMLWSGHITRQFTNMIIPMSMYIVLAVSLNLVVGFLGELNLGHAGFMSIGLFSGCLLSIALSGSLPLIARLPLSMLAGGICAGIFGFAVGMPALRLKGDYLAIVTLAFGQIIKSLINNVFLGFDKNGLHFSFVTNELNMDGGKMLLSGPMGATDTAKISNFSAGIILILITLFVIYSLINSRYGRAIMASRDDRIAASSIGIKVSSIKTLAFVTSAFLAGMAGALYALNYSTLQPAKFDFNTSILALVYVVFGGLGNINGTIISTTVLYILPELLRSLQDYRMLIYAVVLIVVMQLTNSAKVRAALNKVSDSIFKKGASK